VFSVRDILEPSDRCVLPPSFRLVELPGSLP
jgi:hypothetical protein